MSNTPEEWLQPEEDEYPKEGWGFYAGDGEQTIHVYGDVNMSEETLKALFELAKAAKRAIENGEIKPDEDELP